MRLLFGHTAKKNPAVSLLPVLCKEHFVLIWTFLYMTLIMLEVGFERITNKDNNANIIFLLLYYQTEAIAYYW